MLPSNKAAREQRNKERKNTNAARGRYRDKAKGKPKKSWQKMKMKKIPFKSWTEQGRRSDEPIVTDTGTLLQTLMLNIDPKELPRGMENLEITMDLSVALKKAKENSLDHILVEKRTYDFIVNTLLKNVPAIWGFNADAAGVVMGIKNAEEVEVEEKKKEEPKKEEEKKKEG